MSYVISGNITMTV